MGKSKRYVSLTSGEELDEAPPLNIFHRETSPIAIPRVIPCLSDPTVRSPSKTTFAPHYVEAKQSKRCAVAASLNLTDPPPRILPTRHPSEIRAKLTQRRTARRIPNFVPPSHRISGHGIIVVGLLFGVVVRSRKVKLSVVLRARADGHAVLALGRCSHGVVWRGEETRDEAGGERAVAGLGTSIVGVPLLVGNEFGRCRQIRCGWWPGALGCTWRGYPRITSFLGEQATLKKSRRGVRQTRQWYKLRPDICSPDI
jgi:hypothetical protein